MLSKFLKSGNRVLFTYRPSVKHLGGLPKTPYDRGPRPNRRSVGQTLKVHWEIWPLVFVTTAVMVLLVTFSVWASQNKVDVIYTRRGDCISRTMDLCHPTVHKLYTIEQRYEPWPEMVAVLTKMKEAENRVKEEQERANC